MNSLKIFMLPSIFLLAISCVPANDAPKADSKSKNTGIKAPVDSSDSSKGGNAGSGEESSENQGSGNHEEEGSTEEAAEENEGGSNGNEGIGGGVVEPTVPPVTAPSRELPLSDIVKVLDAVDAVRPDRLRTGDVRTAYAAVASDLTNAKKKSVLCGRAHSLLKDIKASSNEALRQIAVKAMSDIEAMTLATCKSENEGIAFIEKIFKEIQLINKKDPRDLMGVSLFVLDTFRGDRSETMFMVFCREIGNQEKNLQTLLGQSLLTQAEADLAGQKLRSIIHDGRICK